MAAGRARRIRRADPSRRRRQVVHIGDHVRGFRHGGDAHRRRRTGQGARPADRVLKAKNLYFVLCILGTTLPYSQLLPFLLGAGVRRGETGGSEAPLGSDRGQPGRRSVAGTALVPLHARKTAGAATRRAVAPAPPMPPTACEGAAPRRGRSRSPGQTVATRASTARSTRSR